MSGDLAWAHGGKSLAFVNGDRVFTISIDGRDFRELARGSFPTWTRASSVAGAAKKCLRAPGDVRDHPAPADPGSSVPISVAS